MRRSVLLAVRPVVGVQPPRRAAFRRTSVAARCDDGQGEGARPGRNDHFRRLPGTKFGTKFVPSALERGRRGIPTPIRHSAHPPPASNSSIAATLNRLYLPSVTTGTLPSRARR